jgi:hypothetical protein
MSKSIKIRGSSNWRSKRMSSSNGAVTACPGLSRWVGEDSKYMLEPRILGKDKQPGYRCSSTSEGDCSARHNRESFSGSMRLVEEWNAFLKPKVTGDQ